MNRNRRGWLTPFVVEILLVSDEHAYGRSIIAPGRENRGDMNFARVPAGGCPTISKRPLSSVSRNTCCVVPAVSTTEAPGPPLSISADKGTFEPAPIPVQSDPPALRV